MIPELGHFTLIVAIVLAAMQCVIALPLSYQKPLLAARFAKTTAWAQFGCVALGFVCLEYAFITHDFTVQYVASHSNTKLPLNYRMTAVWGGHEGSLLLWAWVLTGWMAAVAWFSRALPAEMLARVLGVMGVIAVGFLGFILFTSNPFDRLLPDFPLEGKDLNPLLQDYGMIIHPPMLYMGYVGFAVAFAFACAALLSGRLDAAWAHWSRPWTLVAWSFLTLGVMLGSWWAYRELGWGGWWFWDPVENASFMPWLVGTALIHSLMATEKRQVFKIWTVLLAILAFSLSLLGTFLVRSGVLTSVHAFASDPVRGLYILLFLVMIVGGALTLFTWRVASMRSQIYYGLLSREVFLMLNMLLLLVAAATILLGTLQPIVFEAFDLGKISVGAPYFDLMFSIFMLPVFLIMGVGIHVTWQQHDPNKLVRQLWFVGLLSVSAGGLVWLFAGRHAAFGLASGIAAWILLTHLEHVRHKNSRVAQAKKITQWRGWTQFSRSYCGMMTAHLGVAVCLLGVVGTYAYSVERDVRLAPKQSVEIASYRFVFEHVHRMQGPNYHGHVGQFKVYDGDKLIATLAPEKRIYHASNMPMTEADIDAGFWRDLYVALGEPIDDAKQIWAVRVYYKPWIRWIWLGAILIALGGLWAALDPRYRVRKIDL